MSLSARECQLVCGNCGKPLQRLGQNINQCVACLLDLGWDDEVVPSASAERFDHYEVATHPDGTAMELGRGAMGVTFKAFDTVLGNEVALKVLDPRIAAHSEARERFLREARAAARLRHPNVASVFYYGTRESDGQCFYAMELVQGETLEARLNRSGALPPDVALEVIAQVAKALIALETHRLVHRDLKPSNLMLIEGPEPTVKVIDFGLAKAVTGLGTEADITHAGFVGTPSFASPEQFTNISVDVRSDLYSLGVTLWALLTGQTPFRGSSAEVMYQHQHASLPLDQLESVPQPVVVLLRILLEKDPGRRFQNPGDLLKAMPTITNALSARRRLARASLLKAVPVGSRSRTHKQPARIIPKKISVARLPVTGSNIFGREGDIAFLDRAWANKDINVVTIVAWAGVGKSTLINHWLRRMAAKHYRSAERVFGWSFYRQGTSGDTSSADEFLDAALTWFGDPDSRFGTAWEKGERLAKLVAHRRTLLVLDGLEPLQTPPGPQEGRIREPAIQALLRELAAFNRGLCAITTRLPVTDLSDYEHNSAPRRDLDHLTSDAGAQLLRALGVKGEQTELRTASDEFRGHCLALTLLGSYLTDACKGDIRAREEVSTHLAQDVRQGAQVRKVMASYQNWFGEVPELAILRILGLFDRPADEKALAAVLKSPAIPGLTESLTDLRPTEWQPFLAKLRRAKLLAGEDPRNPEILDTHPLVREYFGEQLRVQKNDAWRECNRRLFHHYQTLGPELPDSFRAMEPLFPAVICGCNAGLLREALHEVYIRRIQRGNDAYAANVLGARGPLLSALVHFFEQGRWGFFAQTILEGQSLSSEDQLYVLMQAGQYLAAVQGLGAAGVRICYERAEPLCHSLNRPLLQYVALIGQWRHTLVTDRMSRAMKIAKQVYRLAQKQNNAALTIGACRAMAGTFYYSGDFDSARRYAMRGVEVWRLGRVGTIDQDQHTPAVGCLCYTAMSEWQFGNTASARANMAEAISVARELNDTNALAHALSWAANLELYERDPAEAGRWVSESIELCTRHNFAYWLAIALIWQGWVMSASGQAADGIPWIEKGISDYRATGSGGVASHLVRKAEALYLADRVPAALEAIDEAEALSERSEQRDCAVDVYRFRGAFLATIGAGETEIEASFDEAIRIAKEQKSVSLQKCTEATYAEYRKQKASGTRAFGSRLPLW